MLNRKRSDFISWGLLLAVVLVLLEATLNGGGILFSLLFSAALLFFGRKRMPKRSGKVMFWLGVFIAVMNVLSMFTFKLLLVAFVIYVIYEFYQSKQNPVFVTPQFEQVPTMTQDDVYRKETLLKNILLGTQQTPEHVYEWNDINIQCGPGDTIIDLNQTILPDGESVILVRGTIGNITIYVPYEMEAAVSHSMIMGNSRIFDRSESKLFNQTLFYRTKGYGEANKKIKIVTNMFAGSLEVKRV